MYKVLFVCLGNICRSPLAMGHFRRKVAAAGLADKIVTDSAGTGAYHLGEPPDARSVQNARENGLDYTHSARQLAVQDFFDFDLIVAMDESNMDNIKKVQPTDGTATLKMMREYDPEGFGAVPDPYFGGAEGFQTVYDILDRSTEALLHQVKQHVAG